MTKVKIFQSKVNGKIKIPSSKSIAHRKIIAACLAFGQESIIENVDISNDIIATIEGMRNLADIKVENHTLYIKSRGVDFNRNAIFDARESGSTLRFLIPIFSFLFNETKIFASERLLQRPLDVYHHIFKDGLKVQSNNIFINQSIKPGIYKIPGNISSQFISGLLFILPLLNQDSTIEITGEYESKSYVDLTIDSLKEFGISIKVKNRQYLIKGNQQYHGVKTSVEGDFSQVAFYCLLGLINNDVEVTNLNKKSLQGDRKIIDVVKNMDANILQTNDGYIFKKSRLKGTTIDLADIPDLGPSLFALSLFSQGQTRFVNTKRLRIKESDRILSMKEELEKFNIKMDVFDNEVIINGQNIFSPKVPIDPHNDHRILMTIAMIATIVGDVIIENVECVNKSYPKFFDDLFSLGVKGEFYD